MVFWTNVASHLVKNGNGLIDSSESHNNIRNEHGFVVTSSSMYKLKLALAF